MSDGTNRSRHPGMGVMLVLTAALLAFACWNALRRQADVDQAVATEANGNRDAWPEMRVNINTAGVAELALLPGVGERLAQRIVDDRNANGPFASLSDLGRVPGMGAATVERLAPFAMAP